jgi:UDP-glucuronate 4-epimerase
VPSHRTIKMPRYLVTGAAGFIGSHVATALLQRGDQVVIVDELNDYYDLAIKHENLNILFQTAQTNGAYLAVYKADCADLPTMERIFEQERPDFICHLAARAGVRPSIKDPELYIRSNINGTVTMLECARKYKVKNFVYASSSSVYGKNSKVPFSESDLTDNPVSPYAATKKACELMAATYHNLYAIPVSGLRFFTVYGPRGRPDSMYLFAESLTR